MQENLPRRRYSARDYGGQQFIETRKSTVRDVMSVKG
jgi:hypothetical protein